MLDGVLQILRFNFELLEHQIIQVSIDDLVPSSLIIRNVDAQLLGVQLL